MLPEKVKKCLSRMSGKLSRTVLRRGKGRNPFSLVDFTSNKYTEYLKEHGVKISMDGKNRWADNIMIERWFRTLKYEEVYLNDYANIRDARNKIGNFINTYNWVRHHSAIGYKSPASLYYNALQQAA